MKLSLLLSAYWTGGITMKKLLGLITATALALSTTVTAFAGEWYDTAYDYCVDRNIISDWYKDKEENNGLMTRGEAAGLLNSAKRRFFYIGDYYPENPFFDLEQGEHYYYQILEMYYSGIFSGGYDENGNLLAMKDDYITREDAAALIVRTYRLKAAKAELAFTDADTISDYAVDDLMTCVSLGIFNGYEDGSLRPKNYVSKAEFINLIYLAGVAADADNMHIDSVSLVTGDMFTDDVKIRITNEDELESGGIFRLEFENVSDKTYYFNPAEFQLEKEIDGQWITQRLGYWFVDQNAWILEPHSTRDAKVDFSISEYEFTDGKYRMVYLVDEYTDILDEDHPGLMARYITKYSAVEFYF